MKQYEKKIVKYINENPVDIYLMWFILIATIILFFLTIFYNITSYAETYDYIQHYVY